MKLYRFRYSAYARKVEAVLGWLGVPHELVEVSYSDRNELAEITGGYVYVPVLVTDQGEAVHDSRIICERLTADGLGRSLLPAPLEGPIWAYHDWVDGPLEDALFRIGSPLVRESWPTAGDRALYVLIKERKYGAGCVDAWQRDQEALIASAQKLLLPTLRTLAARPFLFGDTPTLADAALFGNCLALHDVAPQLLKRIAPELVAFAERCSRYQA